MATYSITIAPTAGGGWDQPAVKRSATALSGGSSISLNTQDAAAKNSIHEALPVVLRAWANYASTTGIPGTNFAALLSDDGNGAFTVTAKYNISSVTGGTTVSFPSATQTTALTLQAAFARAARAIKNDRSTNG